MKRERGASLVEMAILVALVGICCLAFQRYVGAKAAVVVVKAGSAMEAMACNGSSCEAPLDVESAGSR